MKAVNNLSILLKIILDMHFNDMKCLLHINHRSKITDDNLMQVNDFSVHLWDYPVYLKTKLSLDSKRLCRNFLLTSNRPAHALNVFERKIQRNGHGGYNSRRYLIILHDDQQVFEEFFNNSKALHYVRDLLVIVMLTPDSPSNYNKGKIQTDNNRYHNFMKEEEEIFKLYTHKYIGADENIKPILLAIWSSRNKSFAVMDNYFRIQEQQSSINFLYPDKVTDQKMRSINAFFVDVHPYVYARLGAGTELLMFLTFMEKYNFIGVRYYGFSESEVYENWTAKGIFDALLNNNAEDSLDILFGGVVGGSLMDKMYDLTTSSYFGVSAIVPIARKTLGWSSIFKTFDPHIWFSFMLIFSCIYGLIYTENLHIGAPKHRLKFITYFGLIFNQPLVNNYSRCGLRLLIITSLGLSLLFTVTFNTRLLSTLIVPVYHGRIDNVDDICNSNLLLVSHSNYFLMLRHDERARYRELYKRVIETKDTDWIQEQYAKHKYAFGVQKFESGYIDSYVVDIFQDSNARSYKALQDNIFVWKTHFVLRKNSVLMPLLQSHIQRIREAGLLLCWEMAYFRDIKLSTHPWLQQREEEGLDAGKFMLQIAHVRSPFGVLFAGLALAIITFCIEINLKKL